jgi:ATP-dependent DNA helicase RecG
MTDRIPRSRTFTGNSAFKRHKKTPSRKLVPTILADSASESKLQFLPGVGPARAALLAKLGIHDEATLLQHYPRDYEDRRFLYRIREAPIGSKVALQGVIQTVEFSRTRANLGFASATLTDDTGEIEAVWFKKMTPRYDVFASLKQQLQEGKVLLVYGPIEWGPHGRQLRVEDKSVGEDPVHFGRIAPAYSVTEGLSERLVRTLTAKMLASPTNAIPDLVPPKIAARYHVPQKTWAIQKIHFPDTLVQKEEARSALAFEEFLLLETALGRLRQNVQRIAKTHAYEIKRHLLTPFREAMGFGFTGAQKRVIREIFDDMRSAHPMNRLLQGDVGSGKTLVALSAMLLAIENGYQAALMAPTEILAEQHARTIQKFLGKLPVKIALLSGRFTAAQKRATLAQIAAGEADLIIGTHALIQHTVSFSKLKLVVIDEQHRFGVEHRRLLREKGRHTDMLVMTATPIPRTLALTLYGDLDVSTIDELPPGRAPIVTSQQNELGAYRTILEAVKEGRQAYLVYPLVNESDKVELKAAVREAEELRTDIFKNCRVGLLHGQMKAAEKEAVMRLFRDHELDILIATTIIEVGIDVPNATIMAIQHAERFGLATLHQLRGRVGRGSFASQCVLIAETGGIDARRRMEIMTQTNDGFRLSEEDLAMRGPGEILGAQQHGIPLFKAGDLQRDAALIQRTRQAADDLLNQDPTLSLPEHQPLAQALARTLTRWTHLT